VPDGAPAVGGRTPGVGILAAVDEEAAVPAAGGEVGAADAGPDRRDMDRWLGDGGMPLLASLGASLDAYGVDGEELGWVEGSFTPAPVACNPHGAVQAGVHAVLFDACMNFAVNAALPRGDRTRGTLELHTETMRSASAGETYRLRGEVTRLARQVAFAESSMRDADGRLVSRSTGSFLLVRRED
jgi:uncharacterized protein (TIGR00369 family)